MQQMHFNFKHRVAFCHSRQTQRSDSRRKKKRTQFFIGPSVETPLSLSAKNNSLRHPGPAKTISSKFKNTYATAP